jgi:hypothetical protein
MSEALLNRRDYTVILARDAAQSLYHPPGLEQQWQVAEKAMIDLAKKCEKLDPDGLTIYLATTPLQKYEHRTSHTLAQLLQTPNYASPNLDLLGALAAALEEHFARKAQGKLPENGEIVIVILDSEPKERRAIVKLLVAATQKMDSEAELGIMFAQVGEDLITRGFLSALDNDLARAGAKFDIADTKILGEMEESGMTEFLLHALFD